MSGRVAGDVRARGGGDLTTLVLGTVDGGLQAADGGDLRATVSGTVGGGLRTAGGGNLGATVSGRVNGGLRTEGGGDLRATVSGTVNGGLQAAGGGDLTATVTGTVGGGLWTEGGGDLTATVTGTVGGGLRAGGGGDLDATISGRVNGSLRAEGGGALTLDLREGGVVTGTVHDATGPLTVAAGRIGRVLYTNGGTVTVEGAGTLTGVAVGDRTEALRSEAGDLDLTVASTVTGDVRGLGDGDLTATISGTLTGDLVEEGAGDLNAMVTGTVAGDVRGGGAGEHTVTVSSGGTVTGTVHLAATTASTATVDGTIGRLRFDNGGTVTVAGAGKLTGVAVEGRTEALRSEAGDLDLTVMGTVTGDVRGLGAGDLTAAISGTLTGDLVEEGAGDLSATVTGTVGGDVLGGGAGEHTVIVADGGTVTGDVRSMGDGDLTATISGTVGGDVRAEGGGALTLDLKEGGTVTGTVHDPTSPLTVAGSIGRLLYADGGTVTVADAGKLTGVAVDGRTEALRSEAGDLDLTVAGAVTGDVRALGDSDLTAAIAGTLTGDLVEEGAGDLNAMVTGTVTGDVLGRGAGEHTVTVSNGGTVTGTIHLAASTATVDGTAGRVRFDDGGTVTVGRTGRITGLEGVAISNAAGDLDVSVAGAVTGDVLALGDGALTATVTGTVAGNVVGQGAGAHAVTVPEGGTVTGSIDLAAPGSTAAIDGEAGRVRLDGGGTVTVGAGGEITGIGGEAITSAGGDLELVIREAAGETPTEAIGRIGGAVREAGGMPEVRYVKADGRVIDFGEPGRMVPDGAFDLGLRTEQDGRLGFQSGLAPRSRVYEALPSVLLGLNGPPRGSGAVPQSEAGGWARVEASRGKWKADASASQEMSGVGLEYRHRRSDLQAGWTAVVGEDRRFAASVHRRRGSADVTEGGEIKLDGAGVGLSHVWTRGEVYLDVQAEMTSYDADVTSSRHGALKKDVSGHGRALGVEAGRRFALDGLVAGAVLTPRAGLFHSKVSLGGFTDAVDARVTVDDAESLKGRVGVDVEAALDARTRLFGSLEVEHELSKGHRKVVVSGTELKSEADALWLRLGVNGIHAWDGGRYALEGGVSYATSGGSEELGGGLSLRIRF